MDVRVICGVAGAGILAVTLGLLIPSHGLNASLAAEVNASPQAGVATVFYPITPSVSVFGGMFRPAIEVVVDGEKMVGTAVERHLSLSLPVVGLHKLQARHGDPLSGLLRNPEATIKVSASKPLSNSINDTNPGPRVGEAAQADINGSVPEASSDFSTIFVFWPRGLLNFGLFDAFKSDVGVFVDGKPIGAITGGDYVTAKISSGKHVLSLKGGVGLLGGGSEQNMVLGSGRTSYYRITYTNQYFEITELGPEQGAPDLSGLRKK